MLACEEYCNMARHESNRRRTLPVQAGYFGSAQALEIMLATRNRSDEIYDHAKDTYGVPYNKGKKSPKG